MFCPFCNKNINNESIFCPYCKKALPKKPSPSFKMQPTIQVREKPKTSRISANTVRVVVTVAAILVLIFVVLQLYYPSSLPWN
jgi:uncharacterized membrane protein YvbJ